MNLARMTVVAHAYPLDPTADDAVASSSRTRPTPRSCSAAASGPRRSRPLRTPPSGGCWPGSGPPSPAGRPPRCPCRCSLPNPAGSPTGWSLRSVGWPRSWRWSPDWSCWPPGAPAVGFGPGRRPDDGCAVRWGCRAHRQPHHLAGGGLVRLPCPGHGSASIRGPDEFVTADYFAPNARTPPGKRLVRIALSPGLLIRVKSEVQVLPGPRFGL
jgi:hypothetical protein